MPPLLHRARAASSCAHMHVRPSRAWGGAGKGGGGGAWGLPERGRGPLNALVAAAVESMWLCVPHKLKTHYMNVSFFVVTLLPPPGPYLACCRHVRIVHAAAFHRGVPCSLLGRTAGRAASGNLAMRRRLRHACAWPNPDTTSTMCLCALRLRSGVTARDMCSEQCLLDGARRGSSASAHNCCWA